MGRISEFLDLTQRTSRHSESYGRQARSLQKSPILVGACAGE